LGWISKTSYTKLGLREGHDVTDVAPGSSTGITGLQIRTADYTGTASDPILEITYETGGGATSTATTTSYIHTDHLGGTNVVSDQNGLAKEITDYYPFGTQRIHTGSFTEQRKFTGHEYDSESDLTYANARYYDQDIGKFLSQDPVFQNLGVDSRTQQVLQDPQLANAYSYSRNNPLTLTDPGGDFVFIPIILAGLYIADTIYSGYETAQVLNNQSASGLEKAGAVGLFGAGLTPQGKLLRAGHYVSEAARRADEIQAALRGLTRDKTTTAVTRAVDKDGNIVDIISSSENKLRPEQRALLRPGEIEGVGPGHAEVTGLNTAKQSGLTPIETGASRPICPNCAQTLKNENVKAASPLKKQSP